MNADFWGNPFTTALLLASQYTYSAVDVYDRSFDLSGVPDGSSEGVQVSYFDTTGTEQVIWKGNVQFPSAASVSVSPPTLPPTQDPNSSTVTPAGPGGTTTAPVQTVSGPSSSITGGGTGGGTGGTTTQTGNGFFDGSTPGAPTGQGGTGAGTDENGNTFDARIASIKSQLTNALGIDWSAMSVDGPNDTTVSVVGTAIGGTAMNATFHNLIDTSNAMGLTLDAIRTGIRALLSLLVIYTGFQALMKALRRL